jgi:TnpA family transposase
MPRRRALTEAQLETLLALPTDDAVLVRHWTLSAGDLAVIGQRRRDRNQIGFALQLCALRYPGRLLRPGELIPDKALRFIAEQIGAKPEALITYAARFQTRYELRSALQNDAQRAHHRRAGGGGSLDRLQRSVHAPAFGLARR